MKTRVDACGAGTSRAPSAGRLCGHGKRIMCHTDDINDRETTDPDVAAGAFGS
jgi:hypothetical protein